MAFTLLSTPVLFPKIDYIDEKFLRQFSFTSGGYLPPIAAALGGWAAQEVIKALTGKFTPVHQWLNVDFVEVLPGDESPALYLPLGNQWDSIRHVLGQPLCEVEM